MIFGFFKKKKTKPKIGILYICTGKYHIFWDRFYKSAEKYFCKRSSVEYFVFTDFEINTYGNNSVHKYHQPKLGWPFDTLNRFHIFLSQKNDLEKMDYLFFFNANMVFLKPVKEYLILPTNIKSGLVGVIHPMFYKKGDIQPFETNKDSMAYMSSNRKNIYYQGCVSGGTREKYLCMCEVLKEQIDNDMKKNIIAIWHDESHLNKYFSDHEPKKLDPGFAFPEDWKLPFTNRIMQLNKEKRGGHDELRK